MHYLDIGNELQVFTPLYDLDQRARQAGLAIVPGVGFGVVATNCLARYVSDAVGGAQHLGWARATGPDGATAQAWLQTGESYAFTAAASVSAVEEILTRSPRGALSPAAAFGADFASTIQDTTRIDATAAEARPAAKP